MRKLFCLLFAAVFTTNVSVAHAAFVFTLSQVGSNVVGIGSGSFNLTTLTLGQTNTFAGNQQIAPLAAYLLAGSGSTEDFYTARFSGPTSFGSGGQTVAAGTGSLAGIDRNGGELFVPVGYTSGSQLADTLTFNNATASTLGVTPGTYTFSWGSGANADTFTINAFVPEPSTWATLGFGSLSSLALALRRSHSFRRSHTRA